MLQAITLNMLDAILLGVSLGLALSVAAGPIFFLLVDTALIEGRRQALSISLGAITSDVLLMLLSYFITTGLFDLNTEHPLIKPIGGAVFIIFGILYLFKKPVRSQGFKPNPIKAGVKSFFVNCINPGVLIFWLGTMAVAVHTHEGNRTLIAAQFGTTLFTVFSLDIIKIQLAHKVKTSLNPKVIKVISVIIGIGFIGFGGWLLLS